MDERRSKSPVDGPSDLTSTQVHSNSKSFLSNSENFHIFLVCFHFIDVETPVNNENGTWNGNQSPVKSEPVCVFLNQNYDSSDSELQEDRTAKPFVYLFKLKFKIEIEIFL